MISMPLITNLTPVSTDQLTLTLIQGDDYNLNTGQLVEFSSTDWDLDTATCTLKVEPYTETDPMLTATCTPSFASATWTASFTLTAAQTANLIPDSTGKVQKFRVLADFSGDQRTLLTGTVLVIGAIRW
jgi:hypothetical protein